MNILVTGGAGYVGSVVAYHLRQQNHNVVLLDNLSTGSANAAHLTGGAFYQFGIADDHMVRRIVKEHEVDVCVHCAAQVDATESVREPYKYFVNNVEGTAQLLWTLQAAGVRRVVFASSILADVENNPYGWGKKASEDLLKQMRDSYGLSYVTLRFENVAGAHGPFSQWHKNSQTHLIPNIMDVAYGDREYLTVYGDGYALRDYIHVYDIADGCDMAVERIGSVKSVGETYILGSGIKHSVLGVVNRAQKLLGRTIPVVFAPEREDRVPKRQSWEFHGPHIKDAKDLLWAPSKNLDDILLSAWEWKQKNRRGYGD